MNKDTFESILKSFEEFRRSVLSGDYDTQMILTGILSFLIEIIKNEIDSKNIYK